MKPITTNPDTMEKVNLLLAQVVTRVAWMRELQRNRTPHEPMILTRERAKAEDEVDEILVVLGDDAERIIRMNPGS